jgi:hypothetical protein
MKCEDLSKKIDKKVAKVNNLEERILDLEKLQVILSE